MTEVNAPRRRKATRPRRRMALVDATDEAPGGRTLPAIDAGQDLRTVTAAAWRALTAANDPPRLFGYGDLLVRVETHGREKAVTRVLTPDRLRHELARAADWQYDQWSPRGPVVPPDHVIRDMLADPRPPLPRLMQITAAPVFGPTGTLHTTPGYCAEAGSYYAPPPGFRPVTSKQVVNLKVDGITGRWEKMADGKDGRPTNGLKPNAGAKRAWHELLEHRGCEVDITWVGESIPPTIDSTPAVVKRPPVENSTASHEVQGLLSKDRTQPAFDAGREVSNLPAQVIHADWGIDPNKRWQARAFLQPNGRYLVEPAEPVRPLDHWWEASCGGLDAGAVTLAGFDFPIGIPRAYAAQVGVETFRELLPVLGQGEWSEFFKVAREDEGDQTSPTLLPSRSERKETRTPSPCFGRQHD